MYYAILSGNVKNVLLILTILIIAIIVCLINFIIGSSINDIQVFMLATN